MIKIMRRIIKNKRSVFERCRQFFLLPYCYLEIARTEECTRSRLGLARDLLELFFSYKTFPDHYATCRLWEVDKLQWKYYYGHNNQIYQRVKLTKFVQPEQYEILFHDKSVCEILCRGIGINNIPHTYGIISPDQNYREKIESLFQDTDADSFFIKPIRGGQGRRIVLAKRKNGNILIQSPTSCIPLQDFQLLKTSLVQEVIQQDKRMAAFSSASVNTIRILTMYTKNESIIILGAIMRCGVGKSFVDNFHAGGISIGIDIDTGRLRKYGYTREGTRYLEHPTSKILFEGFLIPQWKDILDLAVKIQKAFPCYRILGTDIALKENGMPILIEMNDNPAFGGGPNLGPLFQNEQNLKAFEEYDLFINKHQEELSNVSCKKL